MPFHSDDPLEVHYSGDGKHWTLIRPLHWTDPEKDWDLEVPAGFVTDFASVPRPLWSIFPPTGKYAPAAVLHDWLYFYGAVEVPVSTYVEVVPIDRGYADSVLRRASADLGVSRLTRSMLWLGVRTGGFVAWKRYRGLSEDGG
jgi:hypothetical protein